MTQPDLARQAPDGVRWLYNLHSQGMKRIGWPVRPFKEWAQDREGTSGYEIVDRWLARLRSQGVDI